MSNPKVKAGLMPDKAEELAENAGLCHLTVTFMRIYLPDFQGVVPGITQLSIITIPLHI